MALAIHELASPGLNKEDKFFRKPNSHHHRLHRLGNIMGFPEPDSCLSSWGCYGSSIKVNSAAPSYPAETLGEPGGNLWFP